jgi:dihydrofolate synthase/folylpolyglutamate synthase
MNYKETIEYLFTRLPMFQRIGSAAYKANLDNTIAICKLLGNPEKKFTSIHIAGTNGKGSTSHMLASILQEAGYKTALYTSPHLKDFRERIRIDGIMIPEEEVVTFVQRYKSNFERIEPSFFEMTVGLAFEYFAAQKVDVAVIETGLGGRLDSTNVIEPLLSVITNISLDHVALLGDTIEKIATEKAGIIKPKVPVIIGESDPLTIPVFKKKAEENGAEILFADQLYKVSSAKLLAEPELKLVLDIDKNGRAYLPALESLLPGIYQRKNICTVLCAAEKLGERGFTIKEEHIREGIRNTIKNTGLLGRWQVLSRNPLTIADTGHNEAGIRQVLEQISITPHERLHFVLGMVNDKDITKILKMLPQDAEYYFCQATIPRALDFGLLAKQAGEVGLRGLSYSSVPEALKAAQRNAGVRDLVFVGGSTFTVAEIV